MVDGRKQRVSESTINHQPSIIIKAVLFDLGDTILEFGRVNKTKAFLAGAKSTYAFLQEHRQDVGGFPWYFVRNLVRLRVNYFVANLTRRDFDSLEVLQAVGARERVNLSREDWVEFAWRWYEPLSRCARIEDGLHGTLAALKGMGLKLGIVSNTFVNRASLEKHLRQLGLLEFFPVQLYSYEFHIRKPSREIFQIAADRIGEPAQNILFVGDRIDNDIRPALASGMRAVLKAAYTNEGRQAPPQTLKIRRLAELPALIAQINAAPAPGASTQT
jgi:HAD superfamily hydrolase (TIGR01549 family)